MQKTLFTPPFAIFACLVIGCSENKKAGNQDLENFEIGRREDLSKKYVILPDIEIDGHVTKSRPTRVIIGEPRWEFPPQDTSDVTRSIYNPGFPDTAPQSLISTEQ